MFYIHWKLSERITVIQIIAIASTLTKIEMTEAKNDNDDSISVENSDDDDDEADSDTADNTNLTATGMNGKLMYGINETKNESKTLCTNTDDKESSSESKSTNENDGDSFHKSTSSKIKEMNTFSIETKLESSQNNDSKKHFINQYETLTGLTNGDDLGTSYQQVETANQEPDATTVLRNKIIVNPNMMMRSYTLPIFWSNDESESSLEKLPRTQSEPNMKSLALNDNLKHSADEAKSEPADLHAETVLSTKNGFTTRSEPETRVKSGQIRHSVYFRRDMSTIVLEAIKNKQVLMGEKSSRTLFSTLPECFSPSIIAEKSDSVTVKFVIQGTQQIFTKAFNIFSTVSALRENLASWLSVNSQEIILSKNEKRLDDTLSLLDAGAVPFKTLELTIKVPEDVTEASLLSVKTNYVPMVDIITVKFIDEFGREVERTVEIENQSLNKPWLGGYKHTKTKKIYHHAQTQTKCLLKLKQEYADLTGTPLTQTFSRLTQTPSFPLKNIGVNPVISTGVQTYRDCVFIIDPHDKVVVPKSFKTYEQWFSENNVLEKVIKIQRFLRHRKTKQKIERLLKVYEVLHLEQVKSMPLAEKEETKSLESPHLKKKYNFPIIVSMINEWWKKEKQRIAESKTEAPRKAEMYQLLKKEINLLTALQKKQSEIQKETINTTDMMILDKIAEPIKFRSSTGEMIFIDSLETQKARDFIEVYKKLIQKSQTVRERIEVLLKAKNVSSSSDGYRFSAQLQRLIDRELSLLRIGVAFSDITELQRRIHQLFLDYIKRPEFNPAIVSNNYFEQFNKNKILFTCKRCFKSLPLYEFSADSRKTKLDICNECLKIENVATTRIDFTPYERMLKLIRDDEIKRRCYSSTCFILQPYGIYFIVNVIWYGESALSESDYLPDLRLVRWEVNRVWSPWNCILLTKEEAPVHLRIANIHEVYNPNFIQKIRLKHYTTKSNFKMLLKSDVKIENDSLWQNLKDDIDVIDANEIHKYIEKSESAENPRSNCEIILQSVTSGEE